MASGVGVKITDEQGKEIVWVIDVALKLLEADYVRENPGQWEAHPYWELSLRHFYMADLANLGGNQTDEAAKLIEKRNFKEAKTNITEAEQTFEMALQLGRDSTAFHAMGGYARFLSLKREHLKQLVPNLKNYRKMREDMSMEIDQHSAKTIAINPNNAVFQYNRGKYLLLIKHELAKTTEAFLQSIDMDPRFVLPYQKLKKVLYDILGHGSNDFSFVWQVFVEKLPQIKRNHPRLMEVIEKRLEGMKPKTAPSKRSLKDVEVVKLIDELKKMPK